MEDQAVVDREDQAEVAGDGGRARVVVVERKDPEEVDGMGGGRQVAGERKDPEAVERGGRQAAPGVPVAAVHVAPVVLVAPEAYAFGGGGGGGLGGNSCFLVSDSKHN